jgi:hypothetical protein
MNIQSANTFDPSNEILDIGVLAAASPEFADKMILALLAGAKDCNAPVETCDRAQAQAP